MLPDSRHAPAEFAEFAVHAPIARDVARKFRRPKRRPIFWLSRVLRTPVPEAAVDKDGDLALGWLDRQTFCCVEASRNNRSLKSMVWGDDSRIQECGS